MAGPAPGPPGQRPPLVRRVVQAPDSALARAGHEGDDGEERRPDGPGGLPGLRVVAGDGEANLLTNLKATIRLKIFFNHLMLRGLYLTDREEDDVRGLHGVLCRHDDPPVVDTALLSSLR